jgi:type IV pilus assembly protein PilN
MLKINLLPIRQLKKRKKAINQIAGFICVFLTVLAILAVGGVIQSKEISTLGKNISALENEKKKYEPILAKIKKLQSDKALLEKKIQTIKKLKQDSSLTVHVLDEVANIIDNERMWLLSLNQQGGTLSLTGIALDNQTIAQFMNNLKTSSYVKSVSLADSSLRSLSGKNFKSFSLSCGVGFPAPEQGKTAAK